MGLSTLLAIASAVHGDRLALGRCDDGLSVARLEQLALSGAAELAGTGAATVAFVGINGPAFPVTMFAAAAAGLPVVPLNYRVSERQLNALLDRLEEPVVIADPAYVERIRAPRREIWSSPDWLRRCELGTDRPATPPEDDDGQPAVLLFTSGTTAAPKCVILRHAHLQSYVLGSVDPGSAAEGDTALVSVPPYHVAGVGTVLTNIVAGRRLLYLPDFDPERWLEMVRAEGVTFAMVVPTMLARIVAALDGAQADVPSLRSIAYGGARMPRPVLEAAIRAMPGVEFVNAYGLTETSSTIAILGPADHAAAKSGDDPVALARLGSAGQLVPGIEGEIRDQEGVALAPGEVGELWVRGPQVSGDYVGVGSALRDGWFPTRDRAWFDADGYLFVEGRADDVIIRGGENIAPAEVEDILLQHRDVAEAAVFGVPDDEWGELLVAAIVPAAGRQPDLSELRSWVRARLRSSRTPDRIFLRDELPHTDTGKLLRRVLVADYAATSAGDDPAVHRS
jgi:acyl-CoA synthetase (AMP-forming)/AMP-acid ligase II